MAVTSLFPILHTRDLPRLSRFYQSVLGAVVTYRFGSGDEDDYVSLAAGAASLGIGRVPDAPGASAGDRIALWFYVDDLDAVFDEWTEAGGGVDQPPTDMPWGERVADLRDPDGNLVHVAQAPAGGEQSG